MGNEALPRSMSERWPAVCALHDLEGVPPVEHGTQDHRTPVRFAKAYLEQVEILKAERVVELQDIRLESPLERWMEHFDFDHHLVLDKARSVGFEEELPYDEAWQKVFQRYAQAKKAYLGWLCHTFVSCCLYHFL